MRLPLVLWVFGGWSRAKCPGQGPPVEGEVKGAQEGQTLTTPDYFLLTDF